MPSRSFYLAVHDLDTGDYTIEGPMMNDARWIDAVLAARKAGRKVNCSKSEEATTRAMAQAEGKRSFTGTELPSGSIVKP